jgi:hypothetical protein
MDNIAEVKEPLFEIDGKPVYRGDILYHRDTFRTGGVVKAEFKAEGEYVTVRTVGAGAVPTVKVSELSFEIHEETKQQLKFEQNVKHLGRSRLSQRDRDFYDAGLKAAQSKEPDSAVAELVEALKVLVNDGWLGSDGNFENAKRLIAKHEGTNG